MVENGIGISFISEKAIENEVKLKLIKSLKIKDIPIKRKFYFVFHKKRSLSPLSESFKEFILND